MRSIVSVILLSLPLGASASAQEDLGSRLTDLTRAVLSTDGAAGLAVVIDVGGETLFEGAHGRMHFGGDVVMAVDSSVPAACLMELFTSLLALQQIDQGSLDDQNPLASYVKGLEWKGERVSMHHLLTHTSGVAPISGVTDKLRAVEALFRRSDLWKRVADQPLLSTPGSCQSFNGTNTYLAGKVLEELTGEALPDLIVKLLLDPLELGGTGYSADAAVQLDESAYYVDCAGMQAEDPNGIGRFGAAGLVTTASDLVRIMRGIADQELVSRRAWAHLSGTHKLKDGQALNYAHGLSRTSVDSFAGLAFGGANGHERVRVTYYPGLDLTLAMTADCGPGVLPELTDRLVREVFDLPLIHISDRSMPAGSQGIYLGTYLDGCNRLDLRDAGDKHLLLVSEARPDLRLLYQGGHEFVAESDPGLRLVFQVDGDQARSFVLSMHGTDTLAVRLHEDD